MRFAHAVVAIVATLALAGRVGAVPLAGEWTALAGGPLHNGIADGGPDSFGAELFVTPFSGSRNLVAHSSVVVADNTAVTFESSWYEVEPSVWVEGGVVMAYDATTGAPVWAAPADVGNVIYGSTSSPAIDTASRTVVIGNGDADFGPGSVYGLDLDTGAVQWHAGLDAPVVNASPAIGNGAVYITDFESGAGAGQLYAINTDPAHPTHAVGDVMWQRTIGGTSGNTPLYRDGVVYVTTASEPGISSFASNGGMVYAFDEAGNEVWTSLPDRDPGDDVARPNAGFLGGLNFSDGHLYACSYDYYGDAGLWQIDPLTGSAAFLAACAASDTTPVVTDDAIYVTGGAVYGFWGGPEQRLQCFDLDGTLLWETDPADFIGWYIDQLAYADGNLYVAKVFVDDNFIENRELLILDPTLGPGDAGFVLDQYAGVGTSPALASGVLYTSGLTEAGGYGLFAFGARQEPGPDVIPEPATMALLGLGALALWRRKRR